jgi:hypothetical protein
LLFEKKMGNGGGGGGGGDLELVVKEEMVVVAKGNFNCKIAFCQVEPRSARR